jgi:uncharacterized protein YdhG (YjbR/CyaY superfamily)
MTERGSASAGPLSAYLASLASGESGSPDVAAALGAIVARARSLVPDLTEGTSYAMPALLYRGKPLLSVGERAKHLGYYPFSGKVVSAVQDLLGNIPHSSGAVRFSLQQPLPLPVVDALVLARRDEIDAALGT